MANCTNEVSRFQVEDSTKIWEVPIVEEGSSKGVDIDSFKCGVCPENVTNLTWIDHLAKEHNYLAWKEGEEPLVSFSTPLFFSSFRSTGRKKMPSHTKVITS